MSIAIIDYGSGNLRSAAKAFERAARDAGTNAKIVVTSDPDCVARADRIVLPGVGAFADCRAGLLGIDGMWQALEEAALARAMPFFGICVGMQLMAERGLEFDETPGFGWIRGEVRAIEPGDDTLKIPHMGWNTLEMTSDHPLFAGLSTGPDGHHAYFVHSYHLVPGDPGDLIAQTSYGGPVTAAVGRGNLFGTQFHPEKSQALGLALIRNFLTWKP